MKIKIVGFKVGKSRPTANRTLTVLIGESRMDCHNDTVSEIGEALYAVLQKSDFISIRRIDE